MDTGSGAARVDGAGDQVRDALADRDRVVADALVEAGQHGELDGRREVDVVGRVEDRGDELALEVVEQVVHVGDRRSSDGVVEQVGLARLAEQPRTPGRPCGG